MTLLLREAERQRKLVRRIASSPSAESRLSKRGLCFRGDRGALRPRFQSCEMDDLHQ
jgi:hypothetical protein